MNWFRKITRLGILIILLTVIIVNVEDYGTAEWVHSLTIGLQEADWTLAGEENGDWTAYFASPAGDVNGDGLGDVLIGAPMAGEKECPYPLNPDGTCPGLPKGQGVAYLVLGRADGLTPDPLNLELADASFLGCDINTMTARQLYTAGDVNGDGYDDILVSGWKCGENYRGKAYLFLGRPDVEYWGRYYPVEQADASFLGENEWDFLSYYTATADDVNADGYDDFLITATHHEYDEPCPPGTPETCTTCCRNFIDSSESYNVESDTWTETGNLNIERFNHTALQIGDVVLVAGGQNKSLYLDSAEIFNPNTTVWELTGSLNTARSEHSMTGLLDGSALVAGGQNASGYLDSTEIYDPDTGTWINAGKMHSARSGHTATLLPDGKVLVVGGRDESGSLSNTELYDPVARTWTETGSLHIPRANHTATLLPDGKVLVVAGSNSDGFLNSTEFYDISTGKWTTGGDLNVARADHTATFIPEEEAVLVVGGQDEDSILYNTERFDLTTGIWSSTDTLNNARTKHTATFLPDGRVLVAGGQNLGGSVGSYEFYTPISATWTIGASRSMNIARANHVTVPLSDGNILVAGGRNCKDFGKVYLILGRQEADWGLDFDLSQADASFLGEAVDDRLGRSASGVGDVNGDGFDDFLIGAISSDYAAEDAGQNYLFLGRAAPFDPDYDPLHPWWGNDYSVAWADASFVGEAAGDESGRRVAGAGDVNGDGLDDMLMQAALNDYAGADAGISYLVLGRQAANWGMHYSLAEADASFVGENKRDQSGRRLSGAGDVNNDGFADFITGAPHNEDGSEYPGIIAGKAYLIFGRANVDWGLYFPLSRADIIYVGKPEIGVAGYDMAWLNDFNGDGIDDYLIAAYGGRNNDHVPGEAYVLLGSETPVPTQYLPDELFDIEDVPIRFTGEYWEPNGWQDIQITELVLDDISGGGFGFKVRYDQENNELLLFDDNLGSWLGPCTPGENGRLTNGVIQLECGGSRIITDENHTLRILWRISWVNLPGEDVKFNVFLRATDQSGNDSDYVEFGIWPLPAMRKYLPISTK